MLSGLSLSLLAWLALGGVLLDALLGETRRWHPLVGFGRCANLLENRLNQQGRPLIRVLRGMFAWMLAVLPPVAVTTWLCATLPTWLSWSLQALLLYVCLGLRSLRDHTQPIFAALQAGDMDEARRLTARIVSRDTAAADAADLSKAAVESLLENGNDAVFGTLFWFVVAGAPGAVLFRLVNTLDAMWGYRNARYDLFGRVAARIDDVLNWIPARLTALSYAVLGQTRLALHCWRTQAPAWPSPNAGPVMASGAGALGLALGGSAVYDGEAEVRPPLGSGPVACAADIVRAWTLVARTTALWLAALAMLGWII
ncbi:adenosylcobinamide-phosphate synthase CbiB [Herbaspirillum sp. RTI4]|uniref:adenosylcobinamide-phosphate synthase CbiB n=1 Tax=Herbaspirillum sp. RTI4 TaxID=3048640 RepID=UPI002AB40847|nr:adenosylcobinamide-phosphate synthase CbiB [Herbaspirillum sp. RTI4]MDY7579528.1 adenosylcobinamide-phosphate synthase CbiB [Herbaspirillum sp. RTI4]MEA9983156.1 adenosylcobinamide-phosphate synthase CbiB [Herbaspirillum sp. RTI4]